MTDAILGFGTLLQRGDGAPTEAFATVGEVGDIKGPSGDKDTVEATNHSSPSRYKEYIAGLKDGGDVSFDLNLVPQDSTLSDLKADFESSTTGNWKLVFPDAGAGTASEMAWAGFVTHFEVAAPVADKLTASLSIKITGPVTFTPGTSA